MSLLANPEPGIAIVESFWVSQLELQASENTDRILRGEMARQASGPVTVEHYEVAIFEREAPLWGRQAVRLTRMTVKPSGVNDVIDVFGDTVVPSLAGTPGFRGALLFADPASGRLISETLWRDAQTQAASPSAAAIIRANVLDEVECRICAIEDYVHPGCRGYIMQSYSSENYNSQSCKPVS
jgi:hypothetical protein